MTAFKNVLEMIGNTPLVEVTRLDAGPCRLFLKLENQNPAGSIKDRIGLSMIEAAERDGRLKPGGTIIEATAGNTGLGLALVAAQKGYKLILVVPDKMAREKIFHLRAEVVRHQIDVYSTGSDGRLVWTGTSESVDPASRDEVRVKVASKVVAELVSSGVLTTKG
jgi:threonine dehydratase